jgi:hypothetical protein
VHPINTVAAPGSPAAEDLLSTDRETQAWWQIEAERAPRAGLRDIPALRALRAALRETIEGLAGGCLAPAAAVVDLSLFMQSAQGCAR